MMSFESFVRLGWSFFRTVLRGFFPRRSQLPRFEAQYRPDGVLTTEGPEVAVQDRAQRCFSCGACDVAALERGEFGALGPLGPMAFVVGVTRQAGLDLAVPGEVPPALVHALTEACPVRVPFGGLVDLVRRRRAEAEGASAGLAPRAQLPG
ncbi:MAG: hypothetical protein Q8S73_42670 [Deltaproteobacteria bacterium]|nr:hypothetical protein [Myxococcales bacterium]MDP3220866.1 hypothetical protein [Deltaproteobacteria bacterium]